MVEKEYIEREAAIDEIDSLSVTVTGLRAGKNLLTRYAKHYKDSVVKVLSDAPAADVAPVVHARWITEENTEGYRGDPHCTACKGILDDEAVYGHTPGVDSFFYCPLCGAKMDGATDNNVGGKRKEATP